MSKAPVDLSAITRSAGLDPAIQKHSLETFGPAYRDLLGYVPPRIQARFGTTGVLDPELVKLQEAMRSHAMDTPHLDPKMVQIILFGMLLIDGNDAAETHCLAARRCGASWEELQATISLCFLFRGLPAANRGADLLVRVAAREEQVIEPV
ncbi:carboxymuconolactone decarboxylase family protein [Pseudomonas chlororaphis]|uniref:carboxymuconolactone decarboxylase family protein n=1 Tax=Pseudomonas chlororaphis TaxID=587753 RepID=UPI0003D32632|nr:carboxymuconolactone decarboxylase family protein [Pseudomonas chlororaphis]AZD30506.1 Carboxymuconolactone decarboxylase [Pseudomonas chlororaphis]ETD38834.1 carboxymuconolactone decarboxylase [Pseudomonas chlororaphis subsp. aurantiaca PB-St2]QFS55876.1 carboxymuconolactone decarboxylase family protein [Pseudomonas chlororaphis subsp. aurantiaca]